MIWHEGEVLPDAALSIPIGDRTFEHGLGLFETFRTWDGRPLLLERHRERILRSAGALGLRIEPSSFPDAGAVADLLRVEGNPGDRMVRVTATGGVGGTRSTVWMRSAPLPGPADPSGSIVLVGGWEVAGSDPMSRHKALNYWARRLAADRARAEGCDEALSESDGRLWEGSRTSLFLVLGGEVRTPALRGPIVPGVMRALILEVAAGSAIPTREVEGFAIDELQSADEAFLTNSVRGLMPVRAALRPVGPGTEGVPIARWPAPGSRTLALMDRVRDHLRGGSDSR